MIDYLPRILCGIAQSIGKSIPLDQWQTQRFFGWPLLDSEDFLFLSACKYLELAGVVGWTAGYTSGFLGPSIKEKCGVFTRNAHIKFNRPIRIWRTFSARTKLIAQDEWSVLRVVEFYQSQKLCATIRMQLVVTDKDNKKIPSSFLLGKVNEPMRITAHWPDDLISWKYESTDF